MRGDAATRAARRRRSAAALSVLAASIVLVGLSPRAGWGAIESTSKPVITVSAETIPVRLPRSRMAPATLRLGFTSAISNAPSTPELTAIRLELSRDLELRTAGLPSCPITELYAEAANALHSCAESVVGHGSVISEVTLPGRAPVTVEGRLSAFYDFGEGRPRILAQVVGGSAMPLTYVLPFTIYRGSGAFPTVLSVNQMRFIAGICAIGYPNCFSQTYTYEGIYGHISKFKLSLARRFMHARKEVSFVNADCPAAARSSSAVLPAVSVRLTYPGLFPPSQIATRRCEASPQRHLRRKG